MCGIDEVVVVLVPRFEALTLAYLPCLPHHAHKSVAKAGSILSRTHEKTLNQQTSDAFLTSALVLVSQKPSEELAGLCRLRHRALTLTRFRAFVGPGRAVVALGFSWSICQPKIAVERHCDHTPERHNDITT
jgi:hypothetical protein